MVIRPSAPPLPARRPRRVAMLTFPDVQVLDVMGPLEVFSRASRWMVDEGRAKGPVYEVELLGLKRGALTTSSGLRIVADRAFRDAGKEIDTLLVAGGRGVAAHRRNRALLAWLANQATQVRRLASICTGAFLLAEAGLLEGCAATTHWHHCEAFARDFPGIRIQPDVLFVRAGNRYTSGGVTAGMDLALALVEEDHGREVALATARELVMFLQRPGGQAQFSAQLSGQMAQQAPLRDLQAWIHDHPEADCSVPRLARRARMSPRNFARRFQEETGQTPGRFVAAVRVETARRLLEETDEGLEAIAARSGLGTAESLRRAFLRTVGVTPGQYRARFAR